MNWNRGFSRNLVSKLENKLVFFMSSYKKSPRIFSLTVLESQILPNLQDLDTESQIFQFEQTLHYRRRKIY